MFLEHALLIADIMVALELACRRHGHVRLLTADELPLPETARHARIRWEAFGFACWIYAASNARWIQTSFSSTQRQSRHPSAAVIDDSNVIEKILRHLNLWCGPARFAPARPPPSTGQSEPEPQFFIDSEPMPDYENVITD